MKIEMGKKYRTRSGLDVELIGTDFDGVYSVKGIVWNRDRKQIWSWTTDGSFGIDPDRDLIEVTEPMIPEGWTAWHGGECPVGGDTIVKVIYRNGTERASTTASAYDWHHYPTASDIIAYRVVEPTYRPFENVAEYEKHRDRWLIYKDESLYRSWCYDNQGVFVGIHTLRFQWKYAFEVLKFDDGTPFGVRVE